MNILNCLTLILKMFNIALKIYINSEIILSKIKVTNIINMSKLLENDTILNIDLNNYKHLTSPSLY